MIDSSARIGTNVSIGKGTFIGAYCVIGLPIPSSEDSVTLIGANCEILHHVVVEPGAIVDDEVFIDHFCRIGSRSRIGKKSRILYGARIHDEVTIGQDCRIAGNCPDRTKIGDQVTHMGRINHSYYYAFEDWDAPEEIAATIEDRVVIGANALLIGNIRIGRNTFIAPGEVIRKDIPQDSFCYNSRVERIPDWPQKIKRLANF